MIANATWEEAQEHFLKYFAGEHAQVMRLALEDAGISNLDAFISITDEELKELACPQGTSKDRKKLKLGPRKRV